MEIFMNDVAVRSKRIRVISREGKVLIPGTDEEIWLKEGELLILPDFYGGSQVGKIEKVCSYVIFDDIIVINGCIKFKANLVLEVNFQDIDNRMDINRFRIPFEDKIDLDYKEINKVELTGDVFEHELVILESGDSSRLKDAHGAVIAKGSFTVDIFLKFQ